MRIRLFRFGVSFIWIAALITVILLFFYYINASLSLKDLKFKVNFINNGGSDDSTSSSDEDFIEYEINSDESLNIGKPNNNKNDNVKSSNNIKIIDKKFLHCNELNEAEATINTKNEYQNFDFNAKWMSKKTIWNENFEKKYLNLANSMDLPPMNVVIMPHSHNDPGWLRTFEGYFESHTQRILDNLVNQLPLLDEMTFIWTEISFLELWWQKSNEQQHETFKQLVHDGRIEIMTGGWVMTDEAAAHIYAMVDQMIEGHQWVQANLNITPKNSWSIDPFGHGSTMPYVFGSVDFEGAIIQRIHYNWKEWLANRQYGDFIWRPSWSTKQSEKHSVLMHNMPFDLYFIDYACGPHIDKCKPYDFRWFGTIHETELKAKCDQLMNEYSRAASLYPHNTILAIVGGDFRYEVEYEFKAQYSYKKIIDYVNSNPKRYNNAKLQFGTPKDYFRIIKERTEEFPSLVGDLFPYVDVFTDGYPGYWTGYYTTRPFVKILCRDLEHNLRNAEILFTLGLNKAKQMKNENFVNNFKEVYKSLIQARRNLGLFQHHDAITGTSKAKVMENYLDRLFISLNDTIYIQQQAMKALLNSDTLTNSLNLEKSNKIPEKLNIEFSYGSTVEILLFNSLAQERIDAITVHVSKSNVEILDAEGNSVPSQVNRIFKIQNVTNDVEELNDEFELLFIAKLPPLSLTKFKIKQTAASKLIKSEIYSGNNDDDIVIRNPHFLLSFDKSTGLLKYLDFEYLPVNNPFKISFGGYNSFRGRSGAYLFKTDEKHPEITDIFEKDKLSKIIVTEGEIASTVKVFYRKLLAHSVRILNTNTHLDEGVYIENHINMNENHSNFEIFMRMSTSIKSEAEFFTDLNGFQWQRRKRVSRIGVEGNYYPITSGIFIQDKQMRLTLLTSHAQGATSPSDGGIEIMLDRRTPVDDKRGMEEGVTDNLENVQKHWISLEFLANKNRSAKKYQVPTVHSTTLSYMLKYPVNVFIHSGNSELPQKIEFLKHSFPCDMHLFNLRTLNSFEDEKLPSRSALLIIHRLSLDCKFFIQNGEFYNKICDENIESFDTVDIFNEISMNYVQSTSLTGLKNNGFITSFNHDPIEAMEIRSFNVTFH